MENCQGCGQDKPNVGPWREHGLPPKRLCGTCKLRRTFARPGFVDSLAADARRMLESFDEKPS